MTLRPFDLGWIACLGMVAIAIGCSGTQAIGDDAGPVDTRRLPRVSQTREIFVSPASTIYLAGEPVEKATQLVSEQLARTGWQQYKSPVSTSAGKEAPGIASFKRGTQAISVFFTVPPGQQRRTSVQYVAVALKYELPFPSDAAAIRFDPKIPQLHCTSGQSLNKVLSFFDAELATRGWIRQTAAPNAAAAGQAVTTAYYSGPERPRLELSLEPAGSGRLEIELKGIPAESPAESAAGRDE